jgi:hypothetical protein
MKTVYRYTNTLGRRKELWIDNTLYMNENAVKHPFNLWDLATGECCGYGSMTTKELEEMLSHMKNVEKVLDENE